MQYSHQVAVNTRARQDPMHGVLGYDGAKVDDATRVPDERAKTVWMIEKPGER